MRMLSFLAVCLWLAFSGYWYACKVRCACNDGFALFDTSATNSAPAKSKTTEASIVAQDKPEKKKSYKEPLLFKCNEFELIQGEEYNNLLKSLKRKASVMDSLHVKGYFSTKEVNRSKFADLGLARAQSIREKLAGQFENTAITIDSEVRLEMGIKCDEPFNASGFTWQ